MNHYALGVQYDGSDYNGFQRQPAVPTIQSELEKTLSQIAAEDVSVTAAGRTDARVHATGQVVSFATQAQRPPTAWLKGGNSLLPPSIRINWVQETNAEFNARFAAQWRRYLYVFGLQDRAQVFERDMVTHLNENLDSDKMNAAAQYFLGEQDFSSIRASNCSSSTPFRYIYHLKITQIRHFVVIEVAANAFLLHMVRNLAAVLRAVGNNSLPLTEVKKLLNAKNRELAPPTAAPQGLYLVAVGYPAEYKIPTGLRVPSFLGVGEDSFSEIRLPCDHFQRELPA